MGKFVQYTGLKDQKQVLWLEGRPVWNEGNDFVVELLDQDAALLMRKCSSIFKVVAKSQDIIKILPKAPAKKEEKEPEVEEVHTPEKLYGTQAGKPFKTEMMASAQKIRIAGVVGLDPADMEVVEFADGCWIKEKEKEEVVQGIPADMEMLETQEGTDNVEVM